MENVVRVGRSWRYPNYVDKKMTYTGTESVQVTIISYPRDIDNKYGQIKYSENNKNVFCNEYQLDPGDEICLEDFGYWYGLKIGQIVLPIINSMYFDVVISNVVNYECSLSKWREILPFGWSF